MAKGLLCWLILSSLAVTFVSSKTDSSDVSALNVMYISMNSPSKLDGWQSSGGDPCGDSWKGISCSGSKVTEIDLSDLGLTGSLGYKLSDLTSVTLFDMSKNNLKGNIPYQLPPNVQRLDLSENDFDGTVPYSVSQMTDLKEIYLNGNKLKGPLIDMFPKLSKLTDMDLSSNSLSGDLPQSFRNLSSLNILYLQNNRFTGSIDVLAKLPLENLNVANNKFTGRIPDGLKHVKNIKTGGNSWSGPQVNKNSGLSGAAIAGIILGFLIVLGLMVTLFSRRKSSPPPSHFLEEDKLSQRRPFTPLSSGELSNDLHAESRIDFRELKSSSSFRVKSLRSYSFKPPPSDRINEKRSNAVHVAPYSLADLQTATGNFATARLLGEGSIGCVYKAKYGDGKVLAVENLESSLFEQGKEFTETVSDISKLRHPNICELVGFCSEQGQKMLVYDYFRNGSLHDFLHLSDEFSRPLTWNTRVRIALGTARALEYLHEVCSPPTVHKNIKSSNILLDTELNPRLSDCGLAIFHQRRSQKFESGYNAPECTNDCADPLKSDVYSFGVVMLELMTGQMPFDSRKPKSEQSLVRWASPQLHDIDALEKMADPALHGLYPSKSLSRFADVIALCLQSEPEFRPPMSEVVQALLPLLVQTTNTDLSSSCRTDDDSDEY